MKNVRRTKGIFEKGHLSHFITSYKDDLYKKDIQFERGAVKVSECGVCMDGFPSRWEDEWMNGRMDILP